MYFLGYATGHPTPYPYHFPVSYPSSSSSSGELKEYIWLITVMLTLSPIFE